MFQFFRKIRRSLLGSGSGSGSDPKSTSPAARYTLYSLGEIALVVIGILIALQINNWNQDRMNANEEKELLKSIYKSTNKYVWLSNRGTERHEEVIRAAERLLLTMGIPKSDWDYYQIDKDLHGISHMRWLTGAGTSTNIYDMLIGGGKLGLLSSEELQLRLAELKEEFGYLNIYEGIQVRFIDNQLNSYLRNYIDSRSISAKQMKLDSLLKDSPFVNAYDELLSSKVFSNLLFELIKHTRTLVFNYVRIKSVIIKIDSITIASHPGLEKKNYQ